MAGTERRPAEDDMQKSLHIDPTSARAVCSARWRAPTRTTAVFNPAKSRIKVFDFHHEGRKVPYTCTQCDEAWCMHACPVDAIQRDAATGAKIVLEATCVGCKVCTIACPFGTINYVPDTGKVQKCDLCGGAPACAKACPTGRHHLRRRRLDRPRNDAPVGRQDSTPTAARRKEDRPWHGPKDPAREPRRPAPARPSR